MPEDKDQGAKAHTQLESLFTPPFLWEPPQNTDVLTAKIQE